MNNNSIPIRSLHRILTVPICALLLTVAIARAETVENIDKTFDVKPGGQLVVDVDFGRFPAEYLKTCRWQGSQGG